MFNTSLFLRVVQRHESEGNGKLLVGVNDCNLLSVCPLLIVLSGIPKKLKSDTQQTKQIVLFKALNKFHHISAELLDIFIKIQI